MSIKRKIEQDNFVHIDYERIRDEVANNIKIKKKSNKLIFHKLIKTGVIFLSCLIMLVSLGLFTKKMYDKYQDIDPGLIQQPAETYEQLEIKYNKYHAASKNEYSNDGYSSEGYKNFIAKLIAFSSKISVALYEETDKNDNFVISPISIYMVLTMLMESGDEIVRTEILNTLNMSYEEVSMYTTMLYSQLNEEVYQKWSEEQLIQYEENMTNSIWIDDNIKLNDNGLIELANKYNCNSYQIPIYNDNEKANSFLRDYILQNTKKLIDTEKIGLNLQKDTIFAILNTYYIQDMWNPTNSPLNITDMTYMFNDLVETKLIKGYYTEGIEYETTTYTSFYTETYNKNRIKFIVPKDGYTIEDIYTDSIINNITNYDYIDINHEYTEDGKLIIDETRCIFPKFTASYNGKLNNVLQDVLNIKSIFSEKINFPNLFSDVAYCSEIIHAAKLSVDEKGLLGAAVTAAVVDGTTQIDNVVYKYHDYVIDKDFIYIVTDTYNNPLFIGVINNIEDIK